MQGHVMPSFPHTLVGLGPFADQGCQIIFTNKDVSVCNPQGVCILKGWREETGARLWRFPLKAPPACVVPPVAPPTPPLPPVATLSIHPSRGLDAFDNANQACSVMYPHGCEQYLALATQLAKPTFDPRSLDLPSIGALVGFYHACLGFPVKQTWLDAAKAGNCDSFDGLTYSNIARYCPDSDEIILGHLAQQHQNVRSTRPREPRTPTGLPSPVINPATPVVPSNALHLTVVPLSKLYTDDTGRFPVRARSGNQYVMIAYHVDGNLILQQPFKTKSDAHRLAAYNTIMTRLAAKGLSVDLQLLDNEASAAFKLAITCAWRAKFQLGPPDMHHRNRAERAIRTFKDHFLAILAGVDKSFPPYLWDLLLPQAELTLNLLCQSTINTKILAWEFFNGPFNFNKTPLGPVGCRVLIHAKPTTRGSWDFRAKEGFYIGPALDSYRCFKLVKMDTKSQVFSDTVEFWHAYRTIPVPTAEDRIVHGLHAITDALMDTPPPTTISQLDALSNLRDMFESWRLLAPPSTGRPREPLPGRPRVGTPDTTLPQPRMTFTPRSPWAHPPLPISALRQRHTDVAPVTPRRITFADTPTPARAAASPPRVGSLPPPRVAIEPAVPHSPALPPRIPIAHRTRSRAEAPLALFSGQTPVYAGYVPTPKSAPKAAPKPMGFAGLCRAHAMTSPEVQNFALLCRALSVLDPTTGEFLEHRQLRRDPKFKPVWDKSYANELGRLCQEIGTGASPTSKRVEGTNTLFLINYNDIPTHKRKEICHTLVVCEVRPEKDDPDRTRITIGGSRICYPGDVGTNTASLEFVKILLNSVLSRKGARFSTINLKNFYLDTPMADPEYVRIKMTDIPNEFIEEYNLIGRDRDGWVYFEICQGCYGLPQSGILANNLLRSRLVTEGFYESFSTPGLWRHKWRPLQFSLIVDDFGVEYVGIEHFNFLLDILKKYHGVQFNMAGNKLAGIAITWDYPNRRCRISMPGYIDNLLIKFKHPWPSKPRLSPHACLPIAYGAMTQFAPDNDASALLPEDRKQRIQEIVGSLLYYARAVDNKLLVALSAIASRQAQATVATEQAVHLLLDYVATYPSDGIVYRASDMILCAHADAGFLNETNARSRAGAHIFLLENNPFP
jgi:hypothetical protein